MVILISSGHYYLSDKYGSEPAWGLEIANEYAELGHTVYMVSWILDVSKKVHKNIILYNLSKERTGNPILEILFKGLFPFYSFIICIYICFTQSKLIRVVHHVAPVSDTSYDLFFIFKILRNAIYIIGPAIPPPKEILSDSLHISLGVERSPLLPLIWKSASLFFPILKKLMILTIKNADFMITSTREAMVYYRKISASCNFEIIPIGISRTKFDQRNIINNLKHKKNIKILAVSNLTYRKGIDILIEAMNIVVTRYNIKNVLLEIVGEGHERQNLERLVSNYNLKDYVIFVGHINNFEIAKYYKRADIFCNPTRYEPYGMTTIEAMAVGLPIIASSVNSIPEILGNAGVVFKAEDHLELSRKLKSLIQNGNLRNTLSHKAANRSKLYLWSNVVNQYLNMLLT